MIRLARRTAEVVLVLMMAAMFVAFILQIVFRYFLNWPVAWTDEVCTIVWLWGILGGAAFVVRPSEDIRFDMVYSHLPRTWRRACTVAGSVAVAMLLLVSLPASWSYVSFMKVERSASFGIPMSWMFSIYVAFVVAMVLRQAALVRDALRDRLAEDPAS